AYVFTSNVDGQFQRAGFPDERVVEVHGGIEYLQCLPMCRPFIFPAPTPATPDGDAVAVDPETCRAAEPLPHCPECGALARPNILMFNDGEWLTDRYAHSSDRMRGWLSKLPAGKLVVVELGAGLGIPTVRLFGEQVMYVKGATLIRINPREPEVPSDGEAISLPGGARETLAALADLLAARLHSPTS
ncbi:MAG TPA: Sir2 family NAD-dependent protein deacetylase, partial [Pseudomonadota bacterium]|nr:Sir2 family NAD-dependent protein deacetylase [Pseudomonadota bacterium]